MRQNYTGKSEIDYTLTDTFVAAQVAGPAPVCRGLWAYSAMADHPAQMCLNGEGRAPLGCSGHPVAQASLCPPGAVWWPPVCDGSRQRGWASQSCRGPGARSPRRRRLTPGRRAGGPARRRQDRAPGRLVVARRCVRGSRVVDRGAGLSAPVLPVRSIGASACPSGDAPSSVGSRREQSGKARTASRNGQASGPKGRLEDVCKVLTRADPLVCG